MKVRFIKSTYKTENLFLKNKYKYIYIYIY